YTEGYAKGRAEGLAEGRAEGFAEGRAEGRAETLKEVITHALVARFGEQGAELTPVVQQVQDVDLLWQVYEALLELPTPEAFRQYLAERVENLSTR
ncbi:MAG: transposase, partial [Armatimonadota bacterium]|nr:transposase [Armatimonadota bacterium]